MATGQGALLSIIVIVVFVAAALVYQKRRSVIPIQSLDTPFFTSRMFRHVSMSQVSPVAMSIGKTLVTVILAAHLLSCLWFWVHCFDAVAAVSVQC